MLADRVKRWWRNRKEKKKEAFYEGPIPPEHRLRKEALAFATLHPNALLAEWVEFATKLAIQSYREGWTRGYEYIERDKEPFREDLPPDVVADMIDRTWRESDPVALPEPLNRTVAAALSPQEIYERQLQDLMEAHARRG